MLSTASGRSRRLSSSARVALKTASADPNRSRSFAAARGPTPGVMFSATHSFINTGQWPVVSGQWLSVGKLNFY